ncbi:hypothetical protein DRO91_09835 [Candidatus Heimdallarchaeota archaeon]|nr:MAG: hypothetical protein DRO91_09835 [Candidatus Heimdallarchaeota archaeon]
MFFLPNNRFSSRFSYWKEGMIARIAFSSPRADVCHYPASFTVSSTGSWYESQTIFVSSPPLRGHFIASQKNFKANLCYTSICLQAANSSEESIENSRCKGV